MSLSDILITPLAQIAAPGGPVLHAIKDTDPGFQYFGEAYFSIVNPKAIKAWKRHKRMVMNLIVPVGQIKIVFCSDDLKKFRVEKIGADRYARITVPPGVFFGFQSLSTENSLILNIASLSHQPTEVERLDISCIKFDWNIK